SGVVSLSERGRCRFLSLRDPAALTGRPGHPRRRHMVGAVAMMLVALLGAALLSAAEPASAVGPLMKLYQSGRLPAGRQPAVVEMICNRGNERDLRVVFERVLQPEMAAPLRLKAVGWL